MLNSKYPIVLTQDVVPYLVLHWGWASYSEVFRSSPGNRLLVTSPWQPFRHSWTPCEHSAWVSILYPCRSPALKTEINQSDLKARIYSNLSCTLKKLNKWLFKLKSTSPVGRIDVIWLKLSLLDSKNQLLFFLNQTLWTKAVVWICKSFRYQLPVRSSFWVCLDYTFSSS